MARRSDDGKIDGRNFWQRLFARLDAAIPSPHVVLLGSTIWGVLMAIAAVLAIWRQNGLLTMTPLALATLYFYGGALAFAPGLTVARLALNGCGIVLRFLGSSVVMLLATHIATSGIFALQYRIFYSYWHSSFPRPLWFFQFAFTSAGAVYQYAVTSLYFYWPFTILCILGFAVWFARSNRSEAH